MKQPTTLISHHLKVRRIKNQTHQASSNGTGNRNSHDPSKEQQTHTLEVDGLEGSVAEADTNCGSGDTHGGGDGERVLGEDEDGDGGAHLHGRTTAGGVVGDLVTHDYDIS